MNTFCGNGRLTRDPEVRYSADGQQTIARFSVAVDRRYKKEGEPRADFIPCVCFGTCAKNAEKYLAQGVKIAFRGHIQSGSYKGRDGKTVYTIDVVIEDWEFDEPKRSSGTAAAKSTAKSSGNVAGNAYDDGYSYEEYDYPDPEDYPETVPYD